MGFSLEVVEAKDSSTKELVVKDDESLTEELEVKLEVERLSERDESVAEAGTRWTDECWLIGRFLELLGWGTSFGPRWGL